MKPFKRCLTNRMRLLKVFVVILRVYLCGEGLVSVNNKLLVLLMRLSTKKVM